MVFIPFEASTSTISFIGLVCGVLGDSRLFQVNKLDEVKVKHYINSIIYISRQLKLQKRSKYESVIFFLFDVIPKYWHQEMFNLDNLCII